MGYGEVIGYGIVAIIIIVVIVLIVMAASGYILTVPNGSVLHVSQVKDITTFSSRKPDIPDTSPNAGSYKLAQKMEIFNGWGNTLDGTMWTIDDPSGKHINAGIWNMPFAVSIWTS